MTAPERSAVLIFDERLRRNMDMIQLILLHAARDSLLPELYECFGDKVFDFLELFAGQTIRVPSTDVLKRAARDVHILLGLSTSQSNDKIRYYATRYGISEDRVRGIYQERKALCGQYGVSIR